MTTPEMHTTTPQTRRERRQMLAERVTVLTRQACEIIGIREVTVDVRFDLRGLRAGTARAESFDRATLRLNEALLSGELFPHGLGEVVPHEVAHVAIGARDWALRLRSKPHGREWRALCLQLGGSGRTTHKLPLQRARRSRQYIYRLEDGTETWLGPVRHRRLQTGESKYSYRGIPIPPEAYTGEQR